MTKNPYNDKRLWALALLEAGLMTPLEVATASEIPFAIIEMWAKNSGLDNQIARLNYCRELWAMKKRPREIVKKEKSNLVKAWRDLQRRLAARAGDGE